MALCSAAAQSLRTEPAFAELHTDARAQGRIRPLLASSNESNEVLIATDWHAGCRVKDFEGLSMASQMRHCENVLVFKTPPSFQQGRNPIRQDRSCWESRVVMFHICQSGTCQCQASMALVSLLTDSSTDATVQLCDRPDSISSALQMRPDLLFGHPLLHPRATWQRLLSWIRDCANPSPYCMHKVFWS